MVLADLLGAKREEGVCFLFWFGVVEVVLDGDFFVREERFEAGLEKKGWCRRWRRHGRQRAEARDGEEVRRGRAIMIL